MSDARIKLIATHVRKYLENLTLEERGDLFSKFPAGACGDASLLLHSLLSDEGIDVTCVVSAQRYDEITNSHPTHAWVDWKGAVIDITADQFDPKNEKIYIGPKTALHNA